VRVCVTRRLPHEGLVGVVSSQWPPAGAEQCCLQAPCPAHHQLHRQHCHPAILPGGLGGGGMVWGLEALVSSGSHKPQHMAQSTVGVLVQQLAHCANHTTNALRAAAISGQLRPGSPLTHVTHHTSQHRRMWL
jgi:hypothetical protein